MKKLIGIGLAIFTATLTVVAEPTAQEQQDELKKQIDKLLEAAPTGPHGGKIVSPEIKELMERRSGGVVVPKTNGKTFLIVDGRNANEDFAAKYCTILKRTLHLGMTCIAKPLPKDADPFAFAQGCKTPQNPAVVLIIDCAGKPTLAAYPEDAIAVVNVANLKTGDAALYEQRVSKETWRGVALALGGFAATAPNGRIIKSLLSPVYSVRDLDAMKAVALSPSQCGAIYESVEILGLQAAKPTPYSVACRQGWAPAPTNAIQRAIWDKVHALPTAPIKIAPETKKVKD